MNGAESIARQLVQHGVRVVFGVGGANIEHLFLAIQDQRPDLRAILCKHEHNAGTAADAAARISGRCGVVMATSGGATMNLVPALAEAYASRVPVLALVGEPPRALQGRGAFQDTSGRGGTIDAQRVLGAVARFCVRADDADKLSSLAEEGMARALGAPQGPAVLLISRDLQEATVTPNPPKDGPQSRLPAEDDRRPTVGRGAKSALAAARGLLQLGPILVVAGDRVEREGLRRELLAFVDAHEARVCVTPDGRGAFDNRDPRFLGVLGAMGHSRVASALAEARAVVLVGTALPFLARMGNEQLWSSKAVVALHTEPPWVDTGRLVHVPTALGSCLRELASSASSARIDQLAGDALLASPPSTDRERDPAGSLGFASVLREISTGLGRGGVVLVDAGNTGAAAVHYVDCPQEGRWLIAMGMAGMGYTFGAAIGAALTSGERCTVLVGDGAFYMHGLELHTAVEHRLPITYVLLDNRAHGMCLVREELLLGRRSGYNSFRRADLAAGLAAMFPGLPSRACSTRAELAAGLAEAHDSGGPAVLVVAYDDVEVPPFAGFAALATQRGLSVVPRS